MRYVQNEQPDLAQLNPGDEWMPEKDQPFFHKVWTGGTMGWSTGALGERPEDDEDVFDELTEENDDERGNETTLSDGNGQQGTDGGTQQSNEGNSQ